MSHVMHFHFPPAPDATCENTSKAIDKVLRNNFLHALNLLRAPVHSWQCGIVIYIIQDGPKACTMHAGKTLSEIPTIKYPIKVQFDIKSLAYTLERSHFLFSMKLPSGFPLRFIFVFFLHNGLFSFPSEALLAWRLLCHVWSVKRQVRSDRKEERAPLDPICSIKLHLTSAFWDSTLV